METTDTTQQPAMGLRPTFLTVICILTFIGSGWGIVKGVRTFATADTAAAMTNQILDQAKDQVSDQPNSGFASKLLSSVSSGMSADNLRKSSIISLISCLFTLFGAIMMWQLRKMGFYSYIVGIVIAAIVPPLMIGGVIGWAASAGTAVIGLLFIILYGVNMKYLTR